jgi:ABC-type uncharacterized transport system YnjBCD substrate-binding protein
MKLVSGILFAAVTLACGSSLAGKTDGMFTVEAKASPDKLAAAAKGTVEIVVKVNPEGHISNEAPLKVSLAVKNVQIAKEKYTKADAVYKDGGAALSVPFTAGEKGAATVDAEMTFFICSKEICEKHEKKLSIPVTVQ